MNTHHMTTVFLVRRPDTPLQHVFHRLGVGSPSLRVRNECILDGGNGQLAVGAHGSSILFSRLTRINASFVLLAQEAEAGFGRPALAPTFFEVALKLRNGFPGPDTNVGARNVSLNNKVRFTLAPANYHFGTRRNFHLN